jgi:hypothetical protein
MVTIRRGISFHLHPGLEWNTVAKSTFKSLVWMLLAIVAFYWNIVFTRQYSMMTDPETVTQAYTWFHFWAESIRHGSWPLWDPYAFGGRSYAGEMQTAAFYPLHLIFALFPPNRDGLLATSLYHLYFVFAHVLAAYFMYALIREMGLDQFPAVLAGVIFSLGGFVGVVPWPHLLESSIWLPLEFLLTLRALQAVELRRGLSYAGLAGLTLGMSILAGGLHIVMMQAIALVTAAIYFVIHNRTGWLRPAVIVGAVLITGLAAGAVQLLPSAEYSARAVRFVSGTALPATQKIPIAYMIDSILPRTLLGYLFSWNFQGKFGAGEVLSPYMGVFPLLLAIIGFWKCREHLSVRYSAGLAVAAFLFSLGTTSLLYGLIYALVPLLWMAREASRFLYLAHFGLTILAAFGTQALFSGTETPRSWRVLNCVLMGMAIAAALVLALPLIFGRPELKLWTEWSLLLIILTYPLCRYIAGGGRGGVVRFLVVAFVVFDLHSFTSLYQNKIQVARTGTDQQERLAGMRGAAEYLKAQPGPFRVQVLADPPLNFGDAYGIETLNGGAVTLASNYMGLMSKGAPGIDLLNVRYILKPASAADPNPVYADANWKIYQNAGARSRAWIEDDGFAGVEEHSARHIAVKVGSANGGILVLSELFYPGWEARVNGTPAPIREVDGGLRGIAVPAGESQVTVDYSPQSVRVGASLSALAFALTLLASAIWLRR